MEWMDILLKTILIYIVLLVAMRIMGKREVGQLSVFDAIVYFMVADFSSMVIESEAPLSKAIFPIGIIVSLQVLMSYILLKSKKLRDLIEGKPVVIIKHGQIQDDEMAKSRYNLDDLLLQLREHSVSNVSDVEYALLENSGRLTIFLRESKQSVEKGDLKSKGSLKPFDLPVALIVEGKVQEEGLQKVDQNLFWLKQEIKKKGYKDFKEIFYASICNGVLFIDRKD